MPKNKNAMARYLFLDQLFQNGAGHSIDELVEKLEAHLRLEDDSYTVHKNTVLEDIKFMESSQGWSITLRKWQYGHKKLMAYEDPKYSILNNPLTHEESKQLEQTIRTLSGIKGLPNFEWLEPVLGTLKDKFHIWGTPPGTVSLAQSDNYKALKWFGDLFDAIVQEHIVKLRYFRFGKPIKERLVHPYQLKQYNNRWFLIGMEEANRPRHKYVVVPLDRIYELEVTHDKCIAGPNAEQIKGHYRNIVGVSLNPESKPVTVRLRVGKPDAWYLATKPLHASQQRVADEKDYMEFTLNVIVNEELTQQLMTYGHLKVLEPESLRDEIRRRAQSIFAENGPSET